MDRYSPFLFLRDDGRVLPLQRYLSAKVRFVGHLSDRTVLSEDIVNTIDYLDQTPSSDFFRPGVNIEGMYYMTRWDPSAHWRGFIPTVEDPHFPGMGWMWALADPAPCEDGSDEKGWRLNEETLQDWRQELELWPPIVETLRGLPHCPPDVPIPSSFSILDLEKVYDSQYDLNLSAYRARCCILEHLGWIVWYVSLWEWKRGVAEHIVEVIDEFIGCLSDVRGFIVDFTTDWRNVNLWHLSMCGIPYLVFNIEGEKIGPKSAKFNVELINAIHAFEVENGSRVGFTPSTELSDAWADAQKFDLIFRPRVEVPFYRAQQSRFIESQAVVTMTDAPGWRPHEVSKKKWVAFKYLYDYHVLDERTGVNHRRPDSQQVEFLAWRLLVNWEEYLHPGPARIKIGDTIQRMRDADDYPRTCLAREHYRWSCGPQRGYIYQGKAWVPDEEYDHLRPPASDYRTTPLSSKSFIAARSFQASSSAIQEDITMAEASPTPNLAERISSTRVPRSSPGHQGKRDIPFSQDGSSAKRPCEASRSLEERLHESEAVNDEPERDDDPGNPPSPNFTHLSSEPEFVDAESEYEWVTLSEFIPQTERFLDMEYGVAAYRIPEGFSLDSDEPHLRRRLGLSVHAKIWERLPDTRRSAWNLVIWGHHCLPDRPYLPSLMQECFFSEVAAKFGYISLSREQEAYLRYFGLIHPEARTIEELLKHMVAHSIGFRIMYRVDEFKEILPELKAVTASQRYLAKSSRAYSTQTKRCIWNAGDQAMADDWKAKVFAILHTPHGARCMIERGGNMARIVMLIDPEMAESVFQGPSINVTRHLSGYTNSDTDSDCLLIGDELTQDEEETVWGTMDPVPNDPMKNHRRWIWPSDKMTRQIMKDMWVLEADNTSRDFAGVWHHISDQVFRRIWRELTSKNPDDPTSRTEKGFRDLYRDYYRRFRGVRPYTPRLADMDRAVDIIRDGWEHSWDEVRISSLNIPADLI
ncbi:hypothetical protein BDZ89DRAFT_1035734 [Hymenopellis radicata]|nr:hypothetical protein BDZ89DRAFT_1035734 [Hymenopellis radicata]